MEIPCNNVQNFTLVHAHKPKFGLSLYTSFLLAGKVWTKSSVNPGKETLISSRCVGLFMHRFFTKNGACFFRLALSECSRYTKCTVLWKDLSSLCQLLIWKVDWRANWWRHKWFNDHYSKCRQKSGLALKDLIRWSLELFPADRYVLREPKWFADLLSILTLYGDDSKLGHKWVSKKYVVV